MDMIRVGTLKRLADKMLPLEQAAEGLRMIRDREVMGKVVFVPQDHALTDNPPSKHDVQALLPRGPFHQWLGPRLLAAGAIQLSVAELRILIGGRLPAGGRGVSMTAPPE